MSSAAARGTPAARVRASIARRAWDALLRLDVVPVVLLVVVAHALVVATPGFYSHDEWQKADVVESVGFAGYARQYGAVRAGPDFGYPVRPIGFLEQGVAALFMRGAPWLAHLVNVLNHAACALALAWLLRRAGARPRFTAIAMLAFVVSPLTAQATGWVGASFDQLYVLFLLLAAGVWLAPPARLRTPPALAWLALLTACAVLSKETAVVALPAAVLLAWWTGAWRERDTRGRAAWSVAVVGSVVAGYLLYRAPAIAHSLAGQGAHTYTPSLGNVPGNALRYFAFPFLVNDADMSGHVAAGSAPMVLAVGLHAALVAALARVAGLRAAAGYLAAYFLFLVPVLALPVRGAHYLYGSATALALALAVLAERVLQRRGAGVPGGSRAAPLRAAPFRAAPLRAAPLRTAAALALVAVGAVLLTHTARLQWFVYDTGRCQAGFLADAEPLLAAAGTAAGPVRVEVEFGAPSYVAKRAIFDRRGFERGGTPRIAFSDEDGTAAWQGPAAATVRMTRACRLVAL